MNKEFVPYDLSLELKDIRFDKACFGEYRQWDGNTPWLQLYQDLDCCSTDSSDYSYTTECNAPTYSQAFRWFREEHNIDKIIITNYNTLGKKSYRVRIIYIQDNLIESEFLRHTPNDFAFIEFKTVEEAELACLKKLIKIVKKKR